MESNECLFQDILLTCNSTKKNLKSLNGTHKEKILESSKARKDNHFNGQTEFGIDQFHHDCYCEYTSKEKIRRAKRKYKQDDIANFTRTKQLRKDDPVQNFDFKKFCFFCAEPCAVVPDEKHPDRFEKRPGILCRTADRGRSKEGIKRKSFKEVLLDVCEQRDDPLANIVKCRIHGAQGDLHAANARYHKACYSNFAGERSIEYARRRNEANPRDEAVLLVVGSIQRDPDKIWFSTELHSAYMENGGSESNITRFLDKILDILKDNVYCFKSPGLASMIINKNKAASMFRIIELKDEDEDLDLKKAANRIKQEITQVPTLKNEYPVLSDEVMAEFQIPTLNDLLSSVSSKLSESSFLSLLGSMITSKVTSRVTMLQVAIGLLVHEKILIQDLYDYGVTSSYDEIRRFKISAAASKNNQSTKFDSELGLVQASSDNFDVSLNTQNGLKQTHSLATIITQYGGQGDNGREKIPRLKKEELSKVTIQNIELKRYAGEKKPIMPNEFAVRNPLPLTIICEQFLLVGRGKELDFEFIKKSLGSEPAPDFNGFNTNHLRVTGQTPKPKTKIRFRPLINKKPSDPSTIQTAMIDVETISKSAGQEYSIFTCDQQLYRVTMDIVWSDPDRWQNFIPRLGGMHWVMSFVGCIGKLMSNSGLERVMGTAFGGAEKMLLGKKFPMNVRAIRFVLLELLFDFKEEMSQYDDLDSFIASFSSKNRLTKHWVENFIKPVLLVLLYIRAEREGEFALHLYACEKMVPYFFAAGHWNYARDGILYLQRMERLPAELLKRFRNGEHVIHLKEGLWNGIWSDMGIETTYMKIGKGQTGIVGNTVNSRTVDIWANSHHLCGEVKTELAKLSDLNHDISATHKEEGNGRIKSDQLDRIKLRKTLVNCIHPLKFEEEKKLVNIFTGEEAQAECNVEKALKLGKDQMAEYQAKLPEGFRETLSLQVKLMRKKEKKDSQKTQLMFNTEVIFSRVLYLLGVGRLDFSTLFNFELAPVPTSLFEDTGEGRYCKSKSVLKSKLKVEMSARNINPDTVVIDGGGMLHAAIHWPKDGLVEDFINGIIIYISKILTQASCYIIFDRYFDYSIKSDTRKKRVGQFKRSHSLTLKTPLPAKDVCMSSTTTKQNLIKLIADSLIETFTKRKTKKKLVVTAQSFIPEETLEGVRKKRPDLTTSFDEADYIIPQQVGSAIKGGAKTIKVACADTDVFVLLCAMYEEEKWKKQKDIKVLMQDFEEERNFINVGLSVAKNESLVKSLIPLHAISGCDTVPSMFNIGKVKCINVAKKYPLQHIGKIEANIDDVLDEGKHFVAKCYGLEETDSSKNRLTLWKRKTNGTKVSAKPPVLKSLPPTTEALELNIRRAHFQAMMWSNCMTGSPPDKDPCLFGWEKDEDTKTLQPQYLPNGMKIAPEEVLETTRCNCEVSQCRTQMCSCSKMGIPCTEVCKCHDSGLCQNPSNINEKGEESEDEQEGAQNEQEGDQDI